MTNQLRFLMSVNLRANFGICQDMLLTTDRKRRNDFLLQTRVHPCVSFSVPFVSKLPSVVDFRRNCLYWRRAPAVGMYGTYYVREKKKLYSYKIIYKQAKKTHTHASIQAKTQTTKETHKNVHAQRKAQTQTQNLNQTKTTSTLFHKHFHTHFHIHFSARSHPFTPVAV